MRFLVRDRFCAGGWLALLLAVLLQIAAPPLAMDAVAVVSGAGIDSAGIDPLGSVPICRAISTTPDHAPRHAPLHDGACQFCGAVQTALAPLPVAPPPPRAGTIPLPESRLSVARLGPVRNAPNARSPPTA